MRYSSLDLILDYSNIIKDGVVLHLLVVRLVELRALLCMLQNFIGFAESPVERVC